MTTDEAEARKDELVEMARQLDTDIWQFYKELESWALLYPSDAYKLSLAACAAGTARHRLESTWIRKPD